MRKTTLLLCTLVVALSVYGQNITGQWEGLLKVQEIQLRLVFNIAKTTNGYTSTMDSPDQGIKGVPVTSTTFDNQKLKIEVAKAGIEYNGELKENEIIGTFKQREQEFPLNLLKKVTEKEIAKKPQEPLKPYPYYTEEVTFQNSKANISLAGTLSLPQKEGNFPAVILITGSGPQNRDEEMFGHKPFLVMADYLTKNGIAVLRYDDRGVGQSKGNFNIATSADFAMDVESAIAYLKTRKEINKKKIGLIGHSEGGIIAPMVASTSKDISFIVLLASPGVQGDKLLLQQQELIAKASGISDADIQETMENNTRIFEMIIKSSDQQKLKTDLTNLIKEAIKNDTTTKIPNGMTEDGFIAAQINKIINPWMQYFIKYDPVKTLEKIKCPVLAINGEKDLQVPSKENLTAIENALKKGGNKKVTIKEYANLNHLFQETSTGLPSEYPTIEQTFSPTVLDDITKWIISQINAIRNL